jgi:hypothetical protein
VDIQNWDHDQLAIILYFQQIYSNFNIHLLIRNLKNIVMKKLLFISLLVSGALILSNCSKKDDTTNNNNNQTPVTSGTYSATGTVAFKAGGVDYSIPVTSVNITSASLTINALNSDISNYANLIISVVSSTGISTGTYTIANGTSITFADHSLNMYQASVLESGSSCSISITTLSSSAVKGTFTATAIEYLSGTATVSITSGVINVTLTGKTS